MPKSMYKIFYKKASGKFFVLKQSLDSFTLLVLKISKSIFKFENHFPNLNNGLNNETENV